MTNDMNKRPAAIQESVRGLKLGHFRLQDRSDFRVGHRIWFQFHYDNLLDRDIPYGSMGMAIHRWSGTGWMLHEYKHSFGGPNGRLRPGGGPGGGPFHDDGWQADRPGTFSLTPYVSFDKQAARKIEQLHDLASVGDVFHMGMPIYVAVGRDEPGGLLAEPPARLFADDFGDEIDEDMEDEMNEDPMLDQPESDESKLEGDKMTRQIIEWPAGSGVEAVRIVLSKRQGERWLAHTTLTQSLEDDSRIELVFLEGAAEPEVSLTADLSFAPADSALAFDLKPTERVLGMDVSYAQGRHVDFQKAADAGVKFCFIRACSGRTEKDDNFEHNFAAAGKAGMLRGIYYYMYPEESATIGDEEDRTPEGQARHFASLLKADAELGAVLDVEQKGLSAQQVKRFVDEFQKHDPYGRPITIYTAAWFWNRWRGYSGPEVQWAAGHPLWVAHYTHMEEPIEPGDDFQVAVPKPWSKHLIHQWTSVGGPLAGQAKKGLDLNHFAGTMAELKEWAKSGDVVRPPVTVAGTKYVTAHVLNLRAGPSTQHEVLKRLLKDTAVTILEEGEWNRVIVGDVEGYVYAGFLTDKKPPKKVAPAEKKIDMASYFLPPEGQDAGDIVILQNNYGQGNERQQLQREKGPKGLISYVTKNRQFEKRIVGDKTIDLILDTSPGEGEMYAVKGQWLPRHWAEGEDFTRKEVVTFFRKSDGRPVEGKETYRAESLIKFVKHHNTWRSPGNIELKDVVELHWIAGGRVDERYWFARNLGLVGWKKYDDRESYVVELVKRGSQHDNEREEVPDIS